MKITLFRPVGIYELKKIVLNNLKAFPPRLSNQPIFYPVINLDYAAFIARDWNTKDENSGYCGFVTSFDIDSDYISKYKLKQVGNNIHKEYWVPSESLNEFNSQIIGLIEIKQSYYGNLYEGKRYNFSNKTIKEQIEILNEMFLL